MSGYSEPLTPERAAYLYRLMKNALELYGVMDEDHADAAQLLGELVKPHLVGPGYTSPNADSEGGYWNTPSGNLQSATIAASTGYAPTPSPPKRYKGHPKPDGKSWKQRMTDLVGECWEY